MTIFEAIEKNDVAAAAELLQRNPDEVHARDQYDPDSNPPGGSWAMVELLRRHGATESPPGWLDGLRVIEASLRRRRGLAKRDDTLIFEAVEKDDLAAVTERLQQDRDEVHARDQDNRTPLHRAHSREMAQLLLRHGALVNAPGSMDATPIQEAGERGDLAVVQALREADVDPRTQRHKPMGPEIERRVAVLRAAESQVTWSDALRFSQENHPGVCPGDHLNRFGWLVVGTTGGGNAVVLREDDPAVYFADHTWYADDGIHYQNLAGDGSWQALPLTAEGMRESLFKLAESAEDFIDRFDPEIDAVLDRIG